MKHLYLAATGQNRGKTTVSLGVMDGFQRRGLSTGFMKPVGQRTVIEDGVPADEDAVLMKTVFELGEPLGQMSPVHIPRGFTQAYIDGKVVEDLPARIRAAHARFSEQRLVEDDLIDRPADTTLRHDHCGRAEHRGDDGVR